MFTQRRFQRLYVTFSAGAKQFVVTYRLVKEDYASPFVQYFIYDHGVIPDASSHLSPPARPSAPRLARWIAIRAG